MTTDKLIAILTTYARAAVPAVTALYMAGVTDPKTLAYAFVSAFIAPVWKALDPLNLTGTAVKTRLITSPQGHRGGSWSKGRVNSMISPSPGHS
jgi:hypothetical protein